MFGESRIGPVARKVPAIGLVSSGEEVSDALRFELSKRGLLSRDCEAARFRIDGKVRRFWVDEHVSMNAQYSRAVVEFEVTVRSKAERVVWAAWAEGSFESFLRVDTTEQNQETLEIALEDSIEDLVRFPGFIELLEAED